MQGYIVTLLPGSGIGSVIIGILGALLYFKRNNINTVLFVNQYFASTPVNCFIDYFLDKHNIRCLKFIKINRKYNCKDAYKELFFVDETKDIYYRVNCSDKFNDIVKLFDTIFILHKTKQEEYDKIPNYDICINIRRGDKVTLESHLPFAKTESYLEKIELLALDCPKIFHTSDEYGTFLEIKKNRPEWNIDTLNTPDENGYFISELNAKLCIDLFSHVDKFMKQLHIMKNSTYFIGTNSTSVGYLVKLLRRSVSDDTHNIYIC